MTREYLEMDKQNNESTEPEAVIQRRKDAFQKKQLEFEKTMESASALLFYQVLDELENMHISADNYESHVKTSIKSNQRINEIIMTILTNPTCCSAADNFLAYFSDSINLIMMLQGQ